MSTRRFWIGAAAITAVCGLALAPVAMATPSATGSNARSVAAHWTAARMAAAIPRDIVSDGNGVWYLQGADGKLRGYGKSAAVLPIASKGKPGGGGSTNISNAIYASGGIVQTAAGRLYFEMAGQGYVCSATVVDDLLENASLILTAAHCVFDDVSDTFASNALFIPDQSNTTGTGTDGDCGNDPYGCWVPTDAYVDEEWTEYDWPDNIPFDYGFYLVPTVDAHIPGITDNGDSLEVAVGDLAIDTAAPTAGGYTYALGYSAKWDPAFMFCAQNLGSITSEFTSMTYTNRWLNKCGLSGGASGGPWMQASSGTSLLGNEAIISVNSWGYRGKPGMAGPQLNTTRPQAVYASANGDDSSGLAEHGTITSSW